MMILVAVLAGLFLFAVFYMKQAKFGKLPSGARLEIIKKSPNFKDGTFQNLSPTPSLQEGKSMWEVMYKFFTDSTPNKKPSKALPTIKTDLRNLDINQDVLVWFGHSSYYFQLGGKRFLVDPVLSGSVSPVPFSGKAFEGADVYSVEDFPEIDYLLITHDHYDHLDYQTIIQLRDKVKTVICPLGVGEHLEYWDYPIQKIIEKDWCDKVELAHQMKITLTPARHFSGRTFKRNTSLWTSYVLETPDYKLFIGGDSGYDTHFKTIGEKFGPFDLAILENGQYNEDWKYIHTLPEQIHQVAEDLQTERFFPVHSSKFNLALHAWKEPLERVSQLNQTSNIPIITPKIGEVVHLKNKEQKFSKWWETVD